MALGLLLQFTPPSEDSGDSHDSITVEFNVRFDANKNIPLSGAFIFPRKSDAGAGNENEGITRDGDVFEVIVSETEIRPKYLIVRTGDTLRFTNNARGLTNLYIETENGTTDVISILFGQSFDFKAASEEKLPIRVRDSVAGGGIGYVLIRDDGRGAVTDASGNAALEDVLIGKQLDLTVWAPNVSILHMRADPATVTCRRNHLSFEPIRENPQVRLSLTTD